MRAMNLHRHGHPAGTGVASSRVVKPAYTATYKATWSTSNHLDWNVFWTIHQRPRGATS